MLNTMQITVILCSVLINAQGTDRSKEMEFNISGFCNTFLLLEGSKIHTTEFIQVPLS